MRKKPKNEKHIIGFLFAICLFLSVFLGGMLFSLKSLHIPDLRTVANYQPQQASVIYDRNGRVVERIFTENRTVVTLSEMNPLLPKAFVAAEDGRFYDHPGLDFISVLRAAINNAREGRRGQGGSTITQQVARSLLLTPEKTYIRKFKEAILAWRIDTMLTKDEILFIYLNQIYLGAGAHGVEAASQVYFGKHASQLNLGEVAILAGLPQAPSRYSPIKHLDRAVARQRYVLNRMAADGYIDAGAARKAYHVEPRVRESKASSDPINGYYLDVVKKQAVELLGVPLQTAGARIYTHLDQGLQAHAVESVAKGVRAVRARNGATGNAPQGALVCMEKKNGNVRALVGGVSFTASPFNRATQAKRPVGSTFKPFVYTAALMEGWQPGSTISDAPITISGGNKGAWQPKNYSGLYHGDTTLQTALVKSYNVASVRLMKKVGVKDVHRLAQSAGITSKMPPDLSLALGAVDVSLLEMTGSYTPFVNSGQFVQSSLISRVEYNGTSIKPQTKRSQVVPAEKAQQMRRMLEKVVSEGTGHRAQVLGAGTGGKTGTSDDNRDAWFIGFNRKYLTGVWVGHDRNQQLGAKENGGRTAVPIWTDFMEHAR
ncbi:penicillin-binding protein 1A [Desulfopila sp. IMCC35008]|uniref:penicillin-binding protein 1A n=1 Tax=Desulfopila sp. IMCC35008 TaxID=2653858 RepID=UPI00271497F6|nr:PBP1A family penicillin-binding protein [Desulfopila sp. IMCC35008]